jgi:hypothetical protein
MKCVREMSKRTPRGVSKRTPRARERVGSLVRDVTVASLSDLAPYVTFFFSHNGRRITT